MPMHAASQPARAERKVRINSCTSTRVKTYPNAAMASATHNARRKNEIPFLHDFSMTLHDNSSRR